MSELPRVTVILPVYNEEAFITRSLGAVLAQDYPADLLDVLVVDGMSTDRTRAVIAALDGAERVRVLDNPRRIQAAAMNIGIAAADGAIVVRVDGHTIIAPDYVRTCVAVLDETGAANVGGPMDPVGLTMMGQAIAAAGKSPFAVPTAFHISQQAQETDTAYMGAWPVGVLRGVGGFDERYAINEDYELNVRIRQAGGRIYFSPAIRSQYYGRQTLRALARQYLRYGRYKVQTLRQHPASVRPRQLVAPLFVAGLVIGLPLAAAFLPLRVLWLAALALYALLAVVFSLSAGQNFRQIALLPAVFFTIHAAWGAGFWWGLLNPPPHPTTTTPIEGDC